VLKKKGVKQTSVNMGWCIPNLKPLY